METTFEWVSAVSHSLGCLQQPIHKEQLSGKFEVDFENGGSESRQIIRIRHGYLKMDWDHQVSILAGQTWDVVSPLFPTVNNDTLMWNAGNVGDRRPQFRLAWEPSAGQSQWSFSGAAGLMGAIDAQDLDNNSYRDGEESGLPNVQARVGYAHSSWVKDQRASLGASVFYGWLDTSRVIAGRTSFRIAPSISATASRRAETFCSGSTISGGAPITETSCRASITG
jgi:hypothetical protein